MKLNNKKRPSRSQEMFRKKAYELLQIPEVPTTEVCLYIYGTKAKKSTLNQFMHTSRENSITRMVKEYIALMM